MEPAVTSPDTTEIETSAATKKMQQSVQDQRAYFNTGKTKDLEFRLKMLRLLKTAIESHKENLEAALKKDLNKSETESYATEIGVTIAEINHYISNLRTWVRGHKVPTPLFFLPGKSEIRYEPYGVCLVIGPWNYPFKNLFGPVLGAVSAGNCIVLKPSENAPNTAAAIKDMVSEHFDPEYMVVIEGGVSETTELLKEKFDYLFFTGGTEIGKIIYQAAAKHLTPVTLELGGKSPAIIHKSANLEVTAKRLAWGKFINLGQTCIAPDYLLVDNSIKDKLIERLKKAIVDFYGEDPSKSPDLGRIVNKHHFNRVKGLIEGDVIFGGDSNEEDRFIGPTIINNVKLDDKVMQEEIFGPIIPIIGYDDIEEAIDIINKRPKPLALYVFSNNHGARKKVINSTSSGGVCINETIMHVGSPYLPFGGVGSSGIGAYNGRTGFETFSHRRSVMTRSFMFDVPQKYPPFTDGKLSFIKFALKRLF